MNARPPSNEFPRRWIAPAAVFDRWETAATYYDDLLRRPIASPADFDRWLLDWSEVDAVFEEEYARRYTSMTCQTDDPQRERLFMDFVENIKPLREPVHHRLAQRYIDAATQFDLPPMRYEVLTRSLRTQIRMFRQANVPLETENEKFVTHYQQTIGAMTVRFRGEEKTLPQMTLLQEERDRATREEAWRLTADRYLHDARELDGLYEKMVALRATIARNADYPDFRAYKFDELERFDYSPADCAAFHDAIERVVVPAAKTLNADRKRRLALDRLRPWDLAVDVFGQPALRPFDKVERLMDGCQAIFGRVHRELGEIFAGLRQRDLLDLESRKGKAPGGYQATFPEARSPFIFMNAVGSDDDVRTLLHEGGHAFHTWACREEPLIAYREAPTEFAEVASMGMECLAAPFMDHFYGSDTPRAQRDFFEKIVLFLPYMACVDAFQHFVYTHADAGVETWKDHWVHLCKRFDTGVDWSGLELYERHLWHRKLHIFELPFYYIEYGIAQLGALQVWLASRKNYQQAVAEYRYGLALGGSRPLPELFAAAGCRFDFSEATLKPLIEAVMEEVARNSV